LTLTLVSTDLKFWQYTSVLLLYTLIQYSVMYLFALATEQPEISEPEIIESS